MSLRRLFAFVEVKMLNGDLPIYRQLRRSLPGGGSDNVRLADDTPGID
jgi:hypothetical protein